MKYRNVATKQARLLTQADHNALGGQISTKNGVEPFAPGDYLFKDLSGSWLVKAEDYAGHWNSVGNPEHADDHGFLQQHNLDVVEATQQSDGSYLLADGSTIAQDEFEDFHTPIEE